MRQVIRLMGQQAGRDDRQLVFRLPKEGVDAVEDGCKGHVPVFPNVPYEENKFN